MHFLIKCFSKRAFENDTGALTVTCEFFLNVYQLFSFPSPSPNLHILVACILTDDTENANVKCINCIIFLAKDFQLHFLENGSLTLIVAMFSISVL